MLTSIKVSLSCAVAALLIPLIIAVACFLAALILLPLLILADTNPYLMSIALALALALILFRPIFRTRELARTAK